MEAETDEEKDIPPLALSSLLSSLFSLLSSLFLFSLLSSVIEFQNSG
jgi:hypothetical protein